jgi:hypothetical protein
MQKLNYDELLNISGGSTTVSATLINAFARGISTILELGRSIGSSIRRITTNKVCSF